jgi:hypothetical protein
MVTTVESNRPQVAVPPGYQRSAAPVETPIAAEGFPGTEIERRAVIRQSIWTLSLVVSGATKASMWGLGAVVLGIIGLLGFVPATMAFTATLLLGLGFLTLGYTGWLSHAHVHSRGVGSRWSSRALWNGVLLAWLAGFVGVVLGIAGLVSSTAFSLLGVMAVVFGVTLLASIGLTQPASYWEHAAAGEHRTFFLRRDLVFGLELFVGVGTIVLGILGLLGYASLTLGLVSMLAVGVTSMFVATALCGTTMHAMEYLCPAHRG